MRVKALGYKGKPDFIDSEGVKWWYVGSSAGAQLFLTDKRRKRQYVGVVDGEVVCHGEQFDVVAGKAEIIARSR